MNKSRTAGAVVAAILAAGAARAAEQPGADAQAAGEEQTLDEVTVTGSRITQRTGMTTPTPVTAVTADELETLSPGTLMEALDQLPQFTGNSTPESAGSSWTGAAGQSILNLRGVGSNRTLVLLDGRRVVSSTRRGTTDVNILPEALVQRVDVVTGGASAAYGSDAVAGVVNFVLDKRFTGLKGEVQGGISDYGDNENYELSLSGGRPIGERAHLLLSADYFESAGVPDYLKRDWYQGWGVISNPAAGQVARVIVPDVRSRNWTFGGVIPRGPMAGTQFLEGGVPAPFVTGQYAGTTTQAGGSGEIANLDRTVVPEAQRGSAFSHLTYALNDRFELFGQYLFGYNKAVFDNARNNMTTPWEARIYADNAFLPESLREVMLAGAAGPWNAFTDRTAVALQYDPDGIRWFPFGRQAAGEELSRSKIRTVNRTHSATAGLSGDIGTWRLNASYQWGRNNQRLLQDDLPRVDRLFRSMDAVVDPVTGHVVCRSTLSNPGDGCVPANYFGRGSVSEAAIDYIVGDRTMLQKLTQHFAEAAVDGVLFDLPAGPVSAAFGVSYRKDSLNQWADPPGISTNEPGCTPNDETQGYLGLPATYEGCYGIFERGSIAVIQGSFNVWEVFGETIVPLVRNAPLMESVDLQAAVRYADYSGSGGVVAWKAGLDWTVGAGLRLRGTASRDTRAGTLSERFDQTRRGTTAEDPLFDNESYAFSGIEGGDPNVAPEKADTLTVGAIYQPRWLQGLSMSVDYYDIRIKGAISSLGYQEIIDRCYVDGITELCPRIGRDPVTNRITQVLNTFMNVDEARTTGVDAELIYRTPLAMGPLAGNFTARAIVSYVEELSTTVSGAEPVDLAGQTGPGTGAPNYRGTLSLTYGQGDYRFNVTERYVGPGRYNNNWITGVDITDNHVGSKFYTNLRVSRAFGAAPRRYEGFVAVTNLFNSNPDRTPGSAQFNTALFDTTGRMYTAGLQFQF